MHFISHTAAAAFSCVLHSLARSRAAERQTHDILLDLHCYAAAIIIARGHTLHIFNQHLVGVAFSSRVCDDDGLRTWRIRNERRERHSRPIWQP
jgi:hypothetical protein